MIFIAHPPLNSRHQAILSCAQRLYLPQPPDTMDLSPHPQVKLWRQRLHCLHLLAYIPDSVADLQCDQGGTHRLAL